jgi:hypothetical protein
MTYKHKPLTAEDIDRMRITLSVQEKRLSREPVCDFCGGATPVVVFAASQMSTGTKQECWRWCACEDCKSLVLADDWDSVKNKLSGRLQEVIRGRLSKHTLDMAVESALYEFHMYSVRENAA